MGRRSRVDSGRAGDFILRILAMLLDSQPPLLDDPASTPQKIAEGGGCTAVGFGAEGDLARLRGSHPQLFPFADWSPWCVELRDVAAAAWPRQACRAGGLSGLCALALGGRLDKTLQVSDWARRPLTEAQVRYAALDALAVLRVLGASTDACPSAEARKGAHRVCQALG